MNPITPRKITNGDPSVADLPSKDGGVSLVFGGKYGPLGSL